MIEATQVLGGWLVAAVLAIAVGAGTVRAWRRRAALDEALHELRRPLQAIALIPALDAPGAGGRTPVHLAAAALERLEREIVGAPARLSLTQVAVRPLLEAAVARWRIRAALAGGSIALRVRGSAAATVSGDEVALSQLLDNLIVNAIEHGGPSILVEAEARGGRLTITVSDSGRASRRGPGDGPDGAAGRLPGSGRRGHGLAVVRRIAAEHHGRFMLSRSPTGFQAVVDLPLASESRPAA